MLRLGRRTSLLIAFSLLTSAAAAYAECAWVLWEDMIQSLAEFKSSPVQIVTKDAKRQEASVKTGKTTISYRYVCLPDTIDPRRPKGK